MRGSKTKHTLEVIAVVLLLAFLLSQCSDSPTEPEKDTRSLSLSVYEWQVPFMGAVGEPVTVFDSTSNLEFYWRATVVA